MSSASSRERVTDVARAAAEPVVVDPPVLAHAGHVALDEHHHEAPQRPRRRLVQRQADEVDERARRVLGAARHAVAEVPARAREEHRAVHAEQRARVTLARRSRFCSRVAASGDSSDEKTHANITPTRLSARKASRLSTQISQKEKYPTSMRASEGSSPRSRGRACRSSDRRRRRRWCSWRRVRRREGAHQHEAFFSLGALFSKSQTSRY